MPRLILKSPYLKPGKDKSPGGYLQYIATREGVEVAEDYDGVIPEGFEVITLPEANYLMFQGEPFDEEDYCNAIFAVQTAMDRYAPSVIGYCWDDLNPRIQLEPRGERGYIEMRAVREELK